MAGRGGDVSGAIARPTHTRTTLRRPGAPRSPRLRQLPLPPPAPPSTDLGSLITARPPAPPVTVTSERVIAGSLADQLWEGYVTSVGPLAELAVLKHVDSRDDVLALLANPRVVKLVAWQGGHPVGLGMVTNDLETVVEISPAYLRARFPEHAARDAIYVGMLVMVLPGVRGLTVFSRIYHELWNVPAKANGVLVFDVCEFNRTMFDTDALTGRIASNFPNSTYDVLDRQTWYVAHLPEPLPTPPSRLQPPA
jgi:hypothetical protein